jgi:hypothetical protein
MDAVVSVIRDQLKDDSIELRELVQELWGGNENGGLFRLASRRTGKTFICKWYNLVGQEVSGDEGKMRKLRSYRVERQFYEQLPPLPRMPHLMLAQESWVVLEDLCGEFPERRAELSMSEAEGKAQVFLCLQWLASLHQQFLGKERSFPAGLWEVGSYWHLATRLKELDNLPDNGDLKRYAKIVSQRLQQASHQTLIHGDAKVANFCFQKEAKAVAGLDFQYVGRGIGLVDVHYFLGSCLTEADHLEYERECLNGYFEALNCDPAVEQEWRELYPFVVFDFHRFLQGWRPGHVKINALMKRYTAEVVAKLKTDTGL